MEFLFGFLLTLLTGPTIQGTTAPRGDPDTTPIIVEVAPRGDPDTTPIIVEVAPREDPDTTPIIVEMGNQAP